MLAGCFGSVGRLGPLGSLGSLGLFDQVGWVGVCCSMAHLARNLRRVWQDLLLLRSSSRLSVCVALSSFAINSLNLLRDDSNCRHSNARCIVMCLLIGLWHVGHLDPVSVLALTSSPFSALISPLSISIFCPSSQLGVILCHTSVLLHMVRVIVV